MTNTVEISEHAIMIKDLEEGLKKKKQQQQLRLTVNRNL